MGSPFSARSHSDDVPTSPIRTNLGHINNISYYYTFPVFAPSSYTRPNAATKFYYFMYYSNIMNVCVTDSLTRTDLCYRKDPDMLLPFLKSESRKPMMITS